MFPPNPSRAYARLVFRLFASLFFASPLTLWPLALYAGTMTVNGATCTLPIAIDSANSDIAAAECPVVGTLGSTDTILLPPNTSFDGTGTLYNPHGDGLTATPAIASTIIISGGLAGATVERSADSPHFRLFYVDVNGGELTLQHVTVRNGNSDGDGGAIFNQGVLTLLDSTVFSNTAANGGGILNRGDSFFRGTTTLTNSTIVSNVASTQGGGLFNSGEQSTIRLANSFVRSNSAAGGGGIYNIGAQNSVTLTASFVLSNTAFGDGGGIYNTDFAQLALNDSTIGNNQASFSGGGLYNDSLATTTLIRSTVLSNRTVSNGGGIFNNRAANLLLADANILSNTATFAGGGIYNTFTSTVALTGSTIASNQAAFGNGGGVYNTLTSTVTLTNSNIISNRAGGSGGGLFHSGSIAEIDQSCIAGNSDIAVENTTANTINAANNWWGAPDGPSGEGAGAGDSVSANVDFTPFRTGPLSGCSTLAADLTFGKKSSATGDLLPGQPLTFTLTVTNEGSNPVKSIYVADPLPFGFVLNATNTSGPPVSFNGSSYVITELLASQVATIDFVGEVDPTLNQDLLLQNTATLTNSLVGTLDAAVNLNIVLPRLNWSQQNYAASEAKSNFTATVTLSPQTPYLTVTVQALITDSAESSFAAQAVQTLTFPPGTNSRPVIVPVGSDGVVVSRTIQLALQNPDGALLGPNSNAVIVVTDADAEPDVVVSKSASPTQATAGDTITYTYRITNTGNVPLVDINAVDDQLGEIDDLEAGGLGLNETITTTKSYVVQPNDPIGVLTNTVVVTGTDASGIFAVATAAATVLIDAPTSLPPNQQPQQRMEIYLPQLGRRQQ